MTWHSLGSLILSYEWQSLAQPDTGSSLIRAVQTYQDSPTNYALLSWIYVNGGRTGFKRIYPSKGEPILLQTPIPDVLRQQGLLIRYASLKIGYRTKVYNFDWNISIECFLG